MHIMLYDALAVQDPNDQTRNLWLWPPLSTTKWLRYFIYRISWVDRRGVSKCTHD